jgi:hypothetical protein
VRLRGAVPTTLLAIFLGDQRFEVQVSATAEPRRLP